MGTTAKRVGPSESAPVRVLVVDEDAAIRSILRSGLEAEGYTVSEADSTASLLRCCERSRVSLVTLGLDLEGLNGLPYVRALRERNIPVITTGGGSPADRLAALEQGADDCIVKPFHIQEVLLRVRNVLRRRYGELGPATARSSERYQFAGGVLDVARREVQSSDGAPIGLTDAEFDLLVIFLRRPARTLTRDEIAELLRGKTWSPQDRSIDGHIARLRAKVDSRGQMPRLIKSVRGFGYVFTGDVRRLEVGRMGELGAIGTARADALVSQRSSSLPAQPPPRRSPWHGN